MTFMGLEINETGSNDPIPDHTGEESDANELSKSPFAISRTEAIALSLTLFYYLFLVLLGVLSWFRARHRLLRKRKGPKIPPSPHFELDPTQLHIRYFDEDSM